MTTITPGPGIAGAAFHPPEDPMPPDLIARAEREVVDAAMNWLDEGDDSYYRLREACLRLRRASAR